MNSSWDDNTTYDFNEPQHSNTFAERSSDPSISAYDANLDIPEIGFQITHPDTATIVEVLLMYVGVEEVGPITDYLERYFRSRFRRITGFRAGVVTLLNNEKLWPVIEWREDYDTDVLAIFKVMGPGIPCGCLMHYGDGIVWLERKRWRQSVLAWQITAIEDLGDLFVVAQHILGMLHWSDQDIANLYLKDCPENYSDKQCFSPLLSPNY